MKNLLCTLIFTLITATLLGERLGHEIENSRDLTQLPPSSIVSFWDAESELNQDYIIIGAGIVGLSTSIELKQQQPDARVLILERGTLPIGASSRNAGFGCIGSFTELLMDIEMMGKENAIQQMIERWEGLKTLRNNIGDQEINFIMCGNYELIGSDSLDSLEKIEEINDLLYPHFEGNVFERRDEKLTEFGFSKDYISAVVFNRFEGMLDSGRLMNVLHNKAQKLGVTIRYGSKAKRPIQKDHGLEVAVTVEERTTTFRAPFVAVCINAFTSELIPEIKIKPGRAQILVTEPLCNQLLFDAPVHMGQGFWFFRPMPENRILLGGGRHLDFDGERTISLDITPQIMGPLKKILTSIILPNYNPQIEFCWSGIMGFSEDHLPHIEEVPGLENVVVGFGCNGMGIARGYRTGEKTAALLIKKNMEVYFK
ncbi:MAG: FAD-binding oxidoreductase [Parachlamydiaceae bacterium]|nr:FAD-binding oxidoreductase [Parachlamydiaceae bacterium]